MYFVCVPFPAPRLSYNPQFKVFKSEQFKKQAGLLTFTPSVSENNGIVLLDELFIICLRVA